MTSTQAPNLLAISDKEQAEHALEDKQKAVQKEIQFLIRDLQAVGQLQSAVFVQQVVLVFSMATESLVKNKLNFDAEKRRQQQGSLSEADAPFLLKRLNQCLSATQRDWLKPAFSRVLNETGNAARLGEGLNALNEKLDTLKQGFAQAVDIKLAEESPQ